VAGRGGWVIRSGGGGSKEKARFEVGWISNSIQTISAGRSSRGHPRRGVSGAGRMIDTCTASRYTKA